MLTACLFLLLSLQPELQWHVFGVGCTVQRLPGWDGTGSVCWSTDAGNNIHGWEKTRGDRDVIICLYQFNKSCYHGIHIRTEDHKWPFTLEVTLYLANVVFSRKGISLLQTFCKAFFPFEQQRHLTSSSLMLPQKCNPSVFIFLSLSKEGNYSHSRVTTMPSIL